MEFVMRIKKIGYAAGFPAEGLPWIAADEVIDVPDELGVRLVACGQFEPEPEAPAARGKRVAEAPAVSAEGDVNG